MPQYYGGTQGPAQYAMHQQSRQDQQMSQLLRMFMMMKQSKQRGSEFEQSQELKKEQLDISRKRQEAAQKYNEYLAQPKPITPSSAMKTIEYMVDSGIASNRKDAWRIWKGLKTPEQIKIEAAARAEGAGTGKFKKTPPTTAKPTSYDRKKAAYDKKLANKEITQEQYDEDLLGITPPPSEKETLMKGYTIRQGNESFVKNTFKDVSRADVGKERVKKIPGAVPVKDGLRVDMPFKYNVAELNIGDGIVTEEDKKIMADYDWMLGFFKENILPTYKNFKEFVKLNPGDLYSEPPHNIKLDKVQTRLWFEIYK